MAVYEKVHLKRKIVQAATILTMMRLLIVGNSFILY
jgi:hypothetical protein